MKTKMKRLNEGGRAAVAYGHEQEATRSASDISHSHIIGTSSKSLGPKFDAFTPPHIIASHEAPGLPPAGLMQPSLDSQLSPPADWHGANDPAAGVAGGGPYMQSPVSMSSVKQQQAPGSAQPAIGGLPCARPWGHGAPADVGISVKAETEGRWGVGPSVDRGLDGAMGDFIVFEERGPGPGSGYSLSEYPGEDQGMIFAAQPEAAQPWGGRVRTVIGPSTQCGPGAKPAVEAGAGPPGGVIIKEEPRSSQPAPGPAPEFCPDAKAPPDIGVPPGAEMPTGSGVPPRKGVPPITGVPPGKGCPPGSGVPPSKGGPPGKGVPPSKGVPAEAEMPPASGVPPTRGVPAGKRVPPSGGIPPTTGVPPGAEVPPAIGARPSKGGLPGSKPSPGAAMPPANGVPPGTGFPPINGGPPTSWAPSKEEPPSMNGPRSMNSPPGTNCPPRSRVPPGSGIPPGAKVTPGIFFPPGNGVVPCAEMPPGSGIPPSKCGPSDRDGPPCDGPGMWVPPGKGDPPCKRIPPGNAVPPGSDGPPGGTVKPAVGCSSAYPATKSNSSGAGRVPMAVPPGSSTPDAEVTTGQVKVAEGQAADGADQAGRKAAREERLSRHVCRFERATIRPLSAAVRALWPDLWEEAHVAKDLDVQVLVHVAASGAPWAHPTRPRTERAIEVNLKSYRRGGWTISGASHLAAALGLPMGLQRAACPNGLHVVLCRMADGRVLAEPELEQQQQSQQQQQLLPAPTIGAEQQQQHAALDDPSQGGRHVDVNGSGSTTSSGFGSDISPAMPTADTEPQAAAAGPAEPPPPSARHVCRYHSCAVYPLTACVAELWPDHWTAYMRGEQVDANVCVHAAYGTTTSSSEPIAAGMDTNTAQPQQQRLWRFEVRLLLQKSHKAWVLASAGALARVLGLLRSPPDAGLSADGVWLSRLPDGRILAERERLEEAQQRRELREEALGRKRVERAGACHVAGLLDEPAGVAAARGAAEAAAGLRVPAGKAALADLGRQVALAALAAVGEPDAGAAGAAAAGGEGTGGASADEVMEEVQGAQRAGSKKRGFKRTSSELSVSTDTGGAGSACSGMGCDIDAHSSPSTEMKACAGGAPVARGAGAACSRPRRRPRLGGLMGDSSAVTQPMQRAASCAFAAAAAAALAASGVTPARSVAAPALGGAATAIVIKTEGDSKPCGPLPTNDRARPPAPAAVGHKGAPTARPAGEPVENPILSSSFWQQRARAVSARSGAASGSASGLGDCGGNGTNNAAGCCARRLPALGSSRSKLGAAALGGGAPGVHGLGLLRHLRTGPGSVQPAGTGAGLGGQRAMGLPEQLMQRG